MSDIDFDELDRAVNGALNNIPTPKAAPEIPAPQKESVQTISPLHTPLTPTPAARRSSGRFMDMVHPSSDMRSTNGSRPAETKIQLTPTPQPQVMEPVTSAPAWNEQLESPFLPDTKVEKRPLGTFGSAPIEANEPVTTFDFQGLLDEPKEELLEAPKPQERIEATSTPDPIDFAPDTFSIDALETKIYEKPVEEPQVVLPEEPVGPTSIIPQYKEQPSSNQESGAIYDTESYHQAVAAPVKKRSSLFTIIGIILLVLIGAGAAWAVYTFVLVKV